MSGRLIHHRMATLDMEHQQGGTPRYFALIPASGTGTRMGAAVPKQYIDLASKPMLMHPVDTFAAMRIISHVYVVVSPDDGFAGALIEAAGHLKGRVTLLRAGGATRRQSVLNALDGLRQQIGEEDWVLVHDAARPGLTAELVDRLISAVHADSVGGLLALPVVDTLKRSDQHGSVQQTVARDRMWTAQTPQMFRYGLLRQALTQGGEVTDESSAVEALGLHPRLVKGSPRNLKVTLPHDIMLAELYLKGIA